MPFIKYTEKGRSYAARTSISKTGMLSFSDGACKRFKMGDYKFVVLYYDPDTQRVGVELTNDEQAEGVKKLRHRATGADVAAKSFVDFFNIGVRATTTYEVGKDDESGLVVVDLQTGKQRAVRKP